MGGVTEADTLYRKNFYGIPARVMQSPAAVRLNTTPAPFTAVVYRALVASRDMGIPMWKVLPVLITQWEKMYILAQFGAAKGAIMTTIVDGHLDDNGVQFVGQCQGLITDIPTVDELVHRIITEAANVLGANAAKFDCDNEHIANGDNFLEIVIPIYKRGAL